MDESRLELTRVADPVEIAARFFIALERLVEFASRQNPDRSPRLFLIRGVEGRKLSSGSPEARAGDIWPQDVLPPFWW